jgi:hypothetical protein
MIVVATFDYICLSCQGKILGISYSEVSIKVLPTWAMPDRGHRKKESNMLTNTCKLILSASVVCVLLTGCRVSQKAKAKYSIPPESLNLSEEMDECAASLKTIYTAIREYEHDHGMLPGRIFDLTPKYLGIDALLCPHPNARSGDESQMRYSTGLYSYQFGGERISDDWAVIGGMSFHDWKQKQVEFFGDVVPLVRCEEHGTDVLNLSAGGQIYVSPNVWERMFEPDYTYGDEFNKHDE